MLPLPPTSTLFPYTTLFRSFLREQKTSVEVIAEFDNIENIKQAVAVGAGIALLPEPTLRREVQAQTLAALPLAHGHLSRPIGIIDRKSTRLNSSHVAISYAV